MSDLTDVVVAGAGLAGACVALVLSRTRRVTVLEAERPAAGATGAAAGLVNPYMGRKAKPAWRHDRALDALAELEAAAGAPFVRRHGVVRPATSPSQAEAFRARADAHADLDWLALPASGPRWPAVAAPWGALWVARGGSVDLPAATAAMLAAAVRRGARVRTARLTAWRRDGDDLIAITEQMDVRCRRLVLAVGDGARHLPPLAALPLHRVKGQTVRLDRPLAAGHPAVAGAGYVVPDGDTVIAGATFEHAFTSPAPDPALDAALAARAAALVPGLAGAAVVERRAGVRLTVPSSARRLPLAGELAPGVWVVSGLGAKGLLTAPAIALALPDALDGRRPLAPELWPLAAG